MRRVGAELALERGDSTIDRSAARFAPSLHVCQNHTRIHIHTFEPAVICVLVLSLQSWLQS